MTVDLHIHSIASSDGEYSAEELVKIAKSRGLRAIAIADHETMDSVEQGIYWGVQYGVEVIPACEFACSHKGYFLHILGYCFDVHNQKILRLSEKVEEDRGKMISTQLAKLREAGFFLEEDELMADCNYAIPMGENYARVIFADSRNRDHPLIKEYRQRANSELRFFSEYLSIGKPLHVSGYSPSAEDIINMFREAGGIAILAHPGSNLRYEDSAIIDDLVEYGLAGLEVYTSHHNMKQEEFYYKYCLDKGLLFSCGTDFHGKFKPRVKMGELTRNGYDIVEAIKSRVHASRR